MIWDVLTELNIQIGCSPSKRVLLLLGHLTFSKELDSADKSISVPKHYGTTNQRFRRRNEITVK